MIEACRTIRQSLGGWPPAASVLRTWADTLPGTAQAAHRSMGVHGVTFDSARSGDTMALDRPIREVVIVTGAASLLAAARWHDGLVAAATAQNGTSAGPVVLHIEMPEHTALYADGQCFRFDGPRHGVWLPAWMAFHDCGFALHDALCLALAYATAGTTATADSRRIPASTNPASGSEGHPAQAWPDTPADFPVVHIPEALTDGMAAALGKPLVKGGHDEMRDVGKDGVSDVSIERSCDSHAQMRHDAFASCPLALGLYPVVPDADWVERLVEAGARTIQLRVKSGDPATIRSEIRRAVAATRSGRAADEIRLFINDHWQEALDAGAYGVHLGQEDLAALPAGALQRLRAAGMRVGLSTHGYYEMLLAVRYRPSYVACGPIFATATKAVAAPPQGLQRLAVYADFLHAFSPPVPVVAIGGIGMPQLPGIRAAGAGSAAVVRAVTDSAPGKNLKQTVSALQAAFNG